MLTDYHMTLNRAGIPVWRPAQPVIGREDEHQNALTNWARMMRTQYPALRLYHHIPNGGSADYSVPSYSFGVVPAFVIPQSVQIDDTPDNDGSYRLTVLNYA